MKQDRKLALMSGRADNVWRAAAATLRGYLEGVTPDDVAKRMYPEDDVTPILLRAASTQATTTDATWAAPLTHTAVSDAVEEIVAMSALGVLVKGGALKVDMGRNASVVVPGRIVDPTQAKNCWVGEGQAVPVKQYSLAGGALHVHKIEVIVAVTREMSEASNIEAILRTLLTEQAGLAIDAAVFSTDAASAARSAGILYNLTPIASVGAGFGIDSCGQDLGQLAGDIGSRGGGRNIAFIAAPAQGVAIRFWSGEYSTTGLPVASSPVLAEGTVIGIEPPSFAYSFGTPEFSVGKMAALQMDDAPAGPTMAAPFKSLWQIDAFGLKMTLWGDFAMRAPHVAYMTDVPW